MTGAEMIAAERARQVTEEGWTAEHDADQNRNGELVEAAIFMADPWAPGEFGAPTTARLARVERGSDGFSFEVSSVHPDGWGGLERSRDAKDRVRRLVVAGALIAAEIDRLTAKLPAPRRCSDCGAYVGSCECN